MTVATYEPPDPNEWVRPVAVTVTVLLIAWNVTGWLIDKPNLEGAFIALLTASFQALSFNASAQVRRAASRQQTPSIKRAHRFWKWTLFACSLWSAGSAHHAYGVIVSRDVEWTFSIEALWMALQAAPLLVVLTVAAFIEPFLPWAIETVEAAPRQSETAPVTTPIHQPSPSDAKTVAKALLRQTPQNASRARRDSAEHRVAPRAPPLTEQQLREAVAELTQQGEVVSIRRVAKHLDVPPSRVERSPGKHLLKVAA